MENYCAKIPNISEERVKEINNSLPNIQTFDVKVSERNNPAPANGEEITQIRNSVMLISEKLVHEKIVVDKNSNDEIQTLLKTLNKSSTKLDSR